MEEGLGYLDLENRSYDSDHYVIDIPDQYEYKVGLTLPPNQLGTYSRVSYKSFDSIVNQIQKIHSTYRPFLWVCSDICEPGIFTVTTLGLSYKIYIYTDLESDTYIVELVNVNMPGSVISNIFEKLTQVL